MVDTGQLNPATALPRTMMNDRRVTSRFPVQQELKYRLIQARTHTTTGTGRTLKHLFWPNPLQWVSEITDVLSLSLRLFGNIAGEYMTFALVVLVVPWGIPLILHALSFIPAFVQALVFTLLTSSFLANAVQHEEKRSAAKKAAVASVHDAATAEPTPAQ